MNHQAHPSNQQSGVTVYSLIEPSAEGTPTLQTGTLPYPPIASQAENTEQPWWTPIVALATSLLMLGIGWLMVGYWNMLT